MLSRFKFCPFGNGTSEKLEDVKIELETERDKLEIEGEIDKQAAINRVFVLPKNSYVEIPAPKVMAFGSGGLWEMIRS